MSSEWIKEVSIEDLPEQYREMSSVVGLNNTIKLAEYFGKQGFYFRSLDELIRKKKEEFIKKNFTGDNHKELARATGYSERWVYEILKNGKDDRQVGLFKI
jgi:Mor family transcriptional regulator